jgi:4-amino-4-deoxy-L-arabinose transferase-like glycosyltransferase
MSKWLAAKLRHPLLGFVLVLAPFFLNLGGSALWDASEAFYGETAREMLERSDLIFPTFNYQPRNQKPPLTYWCIAAAYRLIGINEFSTRLPAAIAICFLLAGVVWFKGQSDPRKKVAVRPVAKDGLPAF